MVWVYIFLVVYCFCFLLNKNYGHILYLTDHLSFHKLKWSGDFRGTYSPHSNKKQFIKNLKITNTLYFALYGIIRVRGVCNNMQIDKAMYAITFATPRSLYPVHSYRLLYQGLS